MPTSNGLPPESPKQAGDPPPPPSDSKVALVEAVGEEEFEDLEEEPSLLFVDTAQRKVSAVYQANSKWVRWGAYGALILLSHAWLLAAMITDYDGSRGLLTLHCFAWLGCLYFFVFVPYAKEETVRQLQPTVDMLAFYLAKRLVIWGIVALIVLGLAIFLLVDTANDRNRLRPLLGIAVFLVLLFLCSTNPARIKWRPVFWGLGLQFFMGFLVLRWQTGAVAFTWFANQVVIFLDYTKAGTSFVYGFLAAPPPVCGFNAVFVFSVLQVLIYFGAIVAVLYYLGVMQFVLTRLAWLTQQTLGTTAAESLNACSCIFLGQTEAALLIQPYLARMTVSELHSVMTVGYACVAGSLFAAYISFGAKAQYILSATVMNAPGSIAMSKLLCPETKKSKLKRIEDLELPEGKENNVIECLSNGAVGTVHLVWAIASNLVVFLALLAFADSIVVWLTEMVGWQGMDFTSLMGYLFYPVAWLMGVSEDTMAIAQVIGTKTVLNEFIAYQKLGEMVAKNQVSVRGQMIGTYALCGFSNLSSIGIQLGILGGMCPEKKSVFSAIAVRALVAGMLTNFTTACIAGLLVSVPEPWGGTAQGGHCMPVVVPPTPNTTMSVLISTIS